MDATGDRILVRCEDGSDCYLPPREAGKLFFGGGFLHLPRAFDAEAMYREVWDKYFPVKDDRGFLPHVALLEAINESIFYRDLKLIFGEFYDSAFVYPHRLVTNPTELKEDIYYEPSHQSSEGVTVYAMRFGGDPRTRWKFKVIQNYYVKGAKGEAVAFYAHGGDLLLIRDSLPHNTPICVQSTKSAGTSPVSYLFFNLAKIDSLKNVRKHASPSLERAHSVGEKINEQCKIVLHENHKNLLWSLK